MSSDLKSRKQSHMMMTLITFDIYKNMNKKYRNHNFHFISFKNILK